MYHKNKHICLEKSVCHSVISEFYIETMGRGGGQVLRTPYICENGKCSDNPRVSLNFVPFRVSDLDG